MDVFETVSSVYEYVHVTAYHDLPPSWRIDLQLHRRLWIECLVRDRVPPLMFCSVYQVLLFQQELLAISLLSRDDVCPRLIPMRTPPRPCVLCP